MKLLVRNLPRTMNETELRAMFEAYGRVQYCNLIVDKETGGSKGFGFIEMHKRDHAKAAMEGLNGSEVDGSKIRVKKARDKREKPPGDKAKPEPAKTPDAESDD